MWQMNFGAHKKPKQGFRILALLALVLIACFFFLPVIDIGVSPGTYMPYKCPPPNVYRASFVSVSFYLLHRVGLVYAHSFLSPSVQFPLQRLTNQTNGYIICN